MHSNLVRAQESPVHRGLLRAQVSAITAKSCEPILHEVLPATELAWHLAGGGKSLGSIYTGVNEGPDSESVNSPSLDPSGSFAVPKFNTGNN